MKQMLKAADALPGLALIVIGIIFMAVVGCGGEDPLEPTEMADGAMADMLGATKKAPDAAPAAPSAVPEGTPTVKEVGYYSDWKLTEPLAGTVAPGTTFFIKVVFSEAMQHTIANENTAGKPVLYYRLIGQEQVRFRIAAHGASGEHFTSGDAKPLGSGTDDYIGKYTVPADASESFRIEVGKFNADLEGNNLPAYYTHTETLQLGQPVVEEETPEEPTVEPEPETPADTTLPTVVSITHYRNGVPVEDGESIAPSTIDTKVVFSEAVVPSITYTTGGRTRAYSVSEQGGVHWRGLCKPTDATRTTWLCRQDATAPSFTVTVTTNTADLAGNRLAEAVAAPVHPTEPPPTGDPFSGRVYVPNVDEWNRKFSLPVDGATVTIISGSQSGLRATTDRSGQYTFPNITEDALRVRVTKSGFETKEAVVSLLRPTTINGRTSSYTEDPQNTPGNIVIGHAWPDQVRPILRQLPPPNDQLYVEGSLGGSIVGGNFRAGGFVAVDRLILERAHGLDGVLHTCAHELFHVYQAGSGWDWLDTTAAGRAFMEARAKDWATVGKAAHDTPYTIDLPFESAADTFATWWGLKTGQWNLRFFSNLKNDAPNRWQWAEKYFGHLVR